jgi:ribosomal protein L7/L12
MDISPILVLVLGVIVLIWLVHGRLRNLEKQIAALSRIDSKLDLLLKHDGIEYAPYKNLPRDVMEALKRDEKIQAIKLYRDATGVGLKEAKDIIEAAQRQAGIA